MADYIFTYTGAEMQVLFDLAAGLDLTEVAIGNLAGNVTQGAKSVAIGNSSGATNQGIESVAIGNESGETSQGAESVAVGDRAARISQSTGCVAIGSTAGYDSQGSGGIAIGFDCGSVSQGVSAIALGLRAGKTNQPNYSIVISSDSTEFTPSAVGEILFHTTVTDILSNATELKHNDILIAGSALKTGTLASPPSGMVINEHWLDTTDSANHPIERVAKVAT